MRGKGTGLKTRHYKGKKKKEAGLEFRPYTTPPTSQKSLGAKQAIGFGVAGGGCNRN